jgi:cobyrinic acid a,c-diamide synthase
MSRLLIAGVNSGSGKTTVTSALLAAFRRRGLRGQPFKAGPDYIDPGYLSGAAGVPARNLDPWLLAETRLADLFARAAATADLSLVEGMMGLYDGKADTEEGSTAHLAKLLATPVVLVIDAGKLSRTAAAVALGMQRFDPALHLAGVILNGIASEGHRRWTAGPIEAATGLPVLGYLPHRADLAIPERHLGLIPTAEGQVSDEFFTRLAAQAEQTIDLDRVLAVARTAPALPAVRSDLFPAEPVSPRTRIAVAQDEAFNFYYEDNLDMLRAWGAELVPFSPIHDRALPEGIGGIYIGGGFPELYAAPLAANQAMHDAVRQAARRSLPLYAECGGLMYLCQGIVDAAGERHPMVALVPGWSAIDRPRLSLGYRTGSAQRDSILLRRGEPVRGHEFHWSNLQDSAVEGHAAYALDGAPARLEGYADGGVLATYLHVHFGSDPHLAPRFVAACRDACRDRNQR